MLLFVSTEYKRSGKSSLFIFGKSDDIAVLSGSEYIPGCCFASTISAELIGGSEEEDEIGFTYAVDLGGDNGRSLTGLLN